MKRLAIRVAVLLLRQLRDSLPIEPRLLGHFQRSTSARPRWPDGACNSLDVPSRSASRRKIAFRYPRATQRFGKPASLAAQLISRVSAGWVSLRRRRRVDKPVSWRRLDEAVELGMNGDLHFSVVKSMADALGPGPSRSRMPIGQRLS